MRKLIKNFLFLIIVLILILSITSYVKLYIQMVPPFIGFGIFERDYISVPKKTLSDYVAYKGENNKDALTLLKEKEKAWLEQDPSGMVISINFRKADPKKHEYWAFYVNGKLSNIGARDYKTKNSDNIEWKIEKY